MADLPNINTVNVGIIAFWNAEDHKTAGVVDPLDCTGVFTSYDVYDNGLDGVIALGSGRNFNCRVKNDGWCVAWIDRTNTFFYPNKLVSDFGESGYKGYYDILWSWLSSGSNINSTLTTLSYIISLFEAALETSGDFTFSAGDVGHYCYEFTNANVLTLLDIQKSPGASGTPGTGYIQYTTGTTLYHISIAAISAHGGGTPQGVKFEDNTIAYANSAANPRYGSADILAEGWMPSSLIDYLLLLTAPSSLTAGIHGSILILWS